jgi:hypothetical protein
MTREQLTAILTETRTEAVHLEDGSYLDWSDPDSLEVGDAAGNTVQIPFTFADMKTLVHAMAASLLAEPTPCPGHVTDHGPRTRPGRSWCVGPCTGDA